MTMQRDHHPIGADEGLHLPVGDEDQKVKPLPALALEVAEQRVAGEVVNPGDAQFGAVQRADEPARDDLKFAKEVRRQRRPQTGQHQLRPAPRAAVGKRKKVIHSPLLLALSDTRAGGRQAEAPLTLSLSP
jgi:hypothetical protein